jgi:hypothetical protein
VDLGVSALVSSQHRTQDKGLRQVLSQLDASFHPYVRMLNKGSQKTASFLLLYMAGAFPELLGLC